MPDTRRGPGRGSGTRPGGGTGARRPSASSKRRSPEKSPKVSRSPGSSSASPVAPAPAPSPERRQQVVPRSRASVTSRVALLALVLVVLLVSYAYPLRSWYDQRAERNDLQREASELRQSVADLEAELELWDDPAYVAAQARDRLGFVLPDEDGFVVVPPDDSADAETDDGVEDVAEPEQGTLPGVPGSADMAWYERLWGSVEAAAVPVLETDR